MKKWMLGVVVLFTSYGLLAFGGMVVGVYVMAAYFHSPELLNALWIYWPSVVGMWLLRKWAKRRVENEKEQQSD